MPAAVDREKCNACCDRERMECSFNCPYDAFSLVDGKSFVDENLCDDCKLCIDVCPRGAISHR